MRKFSKPVTARVMPCCVEFCVLCNWKNCIIAIPLVNSLSTRKKVNSPTETLVRETGGKCFMLADLGKNMRSSAQYLSPSTPFTQQTGFHKSGTLVNDISFLKMKPPPMPDVLIRVIWIFVCDIKVTIGEKINLDFFRCYCLFWSKLMKQVVCIS